MADTDNILFPKILHFDDEIYFSRSDEDGTQTIPFYMGALNTSLHVITSTGSATSLTAQGNNSTPSATASFSGGWFDIVTLTGSYFEILNKNVRFIRLKGPSDLGPTFKCLIYNSYMGPQVY